jgi:FkbM family methyltransferase
MLETEDVQTGRWLLTVLKDDEYITPNVKAGHEWDGWMRQDLGIMFRPGMDILDIGGNIGLNTLMFSDFCPVHVFEPLFHEIISKNINQNSLANPVTVHPFGLSSEPRDMDLYFPKKNGTKTNFGGMSVRPIDVHSSESVRVPVKRLDDVYTGKPCVIKIDVEGHELEVLKGAVRTIGEHRPYVYVEVFGNIVETQVHAFFSTFGYQRVIGRPDSNWLFIP